MDPDFTQQGELAMEFEITTLQFLDDSAIEVRFVEKPGRAPGKGISAEFRVPVTYSMDESLTAISDRAMKVLKATLAQ
jgi:hypothetical protein